MTESLLPHRHFDEAAAAELKAYLDKTESFQRLSDIFKLLSDSSRVRIFWLLCHCEECVTDISAIVDMSSPAVSHHLRQLKEAGLIISRRIGKEVFYRASDTEQSKLLHRITEITMSISCPEEQQLSHAEHTISLDSFTGHASNCFSAAQVETVRRVHEYLVSNLEKRCTIDELSRMFLMNPSDLKRVFKAEYGSSIASHIKDHRMERAAELLCSTELSISVIASMVGYESHSKFSAEFKKAYDTLPAAYRKNRK